MTKPGRDPRLVEHLKKKKIPYNYTFPLYGMLVHHMLPFGISLGFPDGVQVHFTHLHG